MPSPIPIVWVKQITDFYCGPAAGVMILNGLGVASPLGAAAKKQWQEKLWQAINQLTTGPDRPEEASSGNGYIEEFEGQQCYLCSGDWVCWAATPQALRDAVNKYLPAGQALKISRSVNEVTVTAAVLKSIDAQSPAAVSAGAESHWVVVRGYLAGEPDLEFQKVGGRKLNGLYVLDPQVDPTDPDGLDFVPIKKFFDQFTMFVKCGSALDKNKKVVIVKKPKQK